MALARGPHSQLGTAMIWVNWAWNHNRQNNMVVRICYGAHWWWSYWCSVEILHARAHLPPFHLSAVDENCFIELMMVPASSSPSAHSVYCPQQLCTMDVNVCCSCWPLTEMCTEASFFSAVFRYHVHVKVCEGHTLDCTGQCVFIIPFILFFFWLSLPFPPIPSVPPVPRPLLQSVPLAPAGGGACVGCTPPIEHAQSQVGISSQTDVCGGGWLGKGGADLAEEGQVERRGRAEDVNMTLWMKLCSVYYIMICMLQCPVAQ